MNQFELKRRWQPMAAIALAFATALVLLLSMTSSASAGYQQFCWGKKFPGGTGNANVCDSLYNDGLAGYINEVGGSGKQHSVCVLAWWGEGAEMCSGGANQGVYNPNPRGEIMSVGQIRNNAAGENTVYGFMVTCATNCNPPPPPPPPPPPGATWHSVESLGGTFTSDLDISSWGPNRLDVFGKGTDNALWHKWWNGTSWSGWQSMGGSLASGPSAVSWGANRIDVVARSSNSTLLHWWWDGTNWYSDNIGGNIASDPDISSWGAGRLDVFGRGPDNALWHRAYDSSYGYYPWESLGGEIAGGPGAVSWAPGRIDIAARTPSNNIAHWWFASNAWNSDMIPGTIISDPDLSSRGSGRLDLFARGSGGGLQHLWWENSIGWSTTWEGLAGSLAGGPGAVSWEPTNRIDVVGRAADGSANHWGWW